MSANRSALPPKTDVTLAFSDLRQRRGTSRSISARSCAARCGSRTAPRGRPAHTFTQAARPQRAPRPQTHQRRFYPPRPDAPRSFHRCRSKVRLGQRQVPEARYPCALSAAAMSLHHGLALPAIRLTEHYQEPRSVGSGKLPPCPPRPVQLSHCLAYLADFATLTGGAKSETENCKSRKAAVPRTGPGLCAHSTFQAP